jgi:hypothetical protein
MNLNKEKDLTGKVLSFGALATLLIVTPWATLDPINVPKFAVLVLVGFVSLALTIRNYQIVVRSEAKALLISAGIFIATLLSAFFSSDLPKWTQVFGVNGRNTGLLTYLALVFVMVAAALMTNKGFEKRIIQGQMTMEIFVNCSRISSEWRGECFSIEDEIVYIVYYWNTQ